MEEKKRQYLSFGTDGVRGASDQFPFTNNALVCLGRAIMLWAQKKKGRKNIAVLIGMDTRESGPRIKDALARGLAAQGSLLVDAGVTTTPAVCQLITSDAKYDIGIVISASHNPYHDNGVKVFDARGGKLAACDEQAITHLFHDLYASGFQGEELAVCQSLSGVTDLYVNNILPYFKKDFLKNYKVVLDVSHGAACMLAPDVMRFFGADVTVVNASPDGKNINEKCGALHPEGLVEVVKKHGADAGFAFDGDGDRVIAVSRSGEIKDGDDILYMLLGLPAYQKTESVVGTVMSNQGFDAQLAFMGKKLLRTPVGDKYVVAQMEKDQLPLGGEASGHIVMRDYLSTGDGLFVALKVLEAMIVSGNHDMQTFEKYPQILLNVPVTHKKDLKQLPFAQIIDQHEKMLHNGRMIVRYSGTENVLRVMTEAPSYENALRVAHDLASTLQSALQ